MVTTHYALANALLFTVVANNALLLMVVTINALLLTEVTTDELLLTVVASGHQFRVSSSRNSPRSFSPPPTIRLIHSHCSQQNWEPQSLKMGAKRGPNLE